MLFRNWKYLDYVSEQAPGTPNYTGHRTIILISYFTDTIIYVLSTLNGYDRDTDQLIINALITTVTGILILL